jgi:hypothetical protein
MICEGDCGVIGGANDNCRGKPKNSEKTCPSATLSHHKSHMTRSSFEPRTAAVGSQRLTAWAMARPPIIVNIIWPSVCSLWRWSWRPQVISCIRLFISSAWLRCAVSSKELVQTPNWFKFSKILIVMLNLLSLKRAAVWQLSASNIHIMMFMQSHYRCRSLCRKGCNLHSHCA